MLTWYSDREGGRVRGVCGGELGGTGDGIGSEGREGGRDRQ